MDNISYTVKRATSAAMVPPADALSDSAVRIARNDTSTSTFCYMCVCEREIERVCVCERERERKRKI